MSLIKQIEDGYGEVAVYVAVLQERFYSLLDSLGAPGPSRWDPFTGELELRGRVFGVEMLGSYDGQSWLWSWANRYLNLGPQRTALARRLKRKDKSLGVEALAVPEIETSDEMVPYMLAALAVGHGLGEAYYIVNHEQVYILHPGQVPAPDSPGRCVELRRAVDAIAATGMPCDFERSIAFAAKALGLEARVEGGRVVVRDGDDETGIELRPFGPLRHVASCFCPRPCSLDGLVEHVRAEPDLAALSIEKATDSAFSVSGEGFEVRVTLGGRLADVERAADALPRRGHDARRSSAAIVVEAAHAADFPGAVYVKHAGLFAGGGDAVWAPLERDPADAAPTGGKTIAWPALAVCERLGALEGALVFDVLLNTFYDHA